MPHPNEKDERFLSIRREFRANDGSLILDLRAISKDEGLTSEQKKDMRQRRFGSHAKAYEAYQDALQKGFEDENSEQITAAHEMLKRASAAVKDARKQANATSEILLKLAGAADKAKNLVELFD